MAILLPLLTENCLYNCNSRFLSENPHLYDLVVWSLQKFLHCVYPRLLNIFIRYKYYLKENSPNSPLDTNTLKVGDPTRDLVTIFQPKKIKFSSRFQKNIFVYTDDIVDLKVAFSQTKRSFVMDFDYFKREKLPNFNHYF